MKSPVKLLWFFSKPGREYQAPISCLPKMHWSLLQKSFVKEGINNMGTKSNALKEAINPLIEKNNTGTFNKKKKAQASKRKKR